LVIEAGLVGILLKIAVTNPASFFGPGLLIVGLFGVALFMVSVLVWMLWITSSNLIITPEHLVVRNRIWRTTTTIAWSDVVGVTKINRSWWNRIGQMALNEIRARDGQRVLFGTHLFWYGEFLALLRDRCRTCRAFDPHPYGIGERPVSAS
jgi:hypothetical protein